MINAVILRAVESLLTVGALLLSLLVFSLVLNSVEVPTWVPAWLSDFTTTTFTVAVLMGLVAYWVLGILRTHLMAFWVLAVVSLALELPAVLSHNQLDWLFFFTGQRWLDPPASSLEVGFYFLITLAVLVLLYRTILLMDQERTVRRQGVDELEYRQIMLQQYLFIAGLTCGSLALTGGLVFLSTALGGVGNLLERSPWTVLTVGGLATLIISATLLYWIRDSEAG